MTPKARWLVHHGGLPGWLGEFYVVIDLCRPPSMTLALVWSCSAGSFWQIQLLLLMF
jgi:hypothetical protein